MYRARKQQINKKELERRHRGDFIQESLYYTILSDAAVHSSKIARVEQKAATQVDTQRHTPFTTHGC